MSSPTQSRTDPPASAAPPSTTDVPANLSPLLKNDPSRTGFDPEVGYWMNMFSYLTSNMTREGQFHFRESLYRENEKEDCKRCEEYRDWLFAYSPIVRFMSGKIADLNGSIDDKNVYCVRCPARLTVDGEVVRTGGGFNPYSGIKICANEVRDRKHLEDTLTHEMVHAWDFLRWKMDGVHNLKHAACTEIRASMLSGECRWTREAFTRGNWKVTQQFQNCVRSRAIMSVLNRPGCKDEAHASRIVNEVWNSCYSDTRPFDEVYK
ncbi:related to Ku70-binding protein [Cephalotrichum gorgonifer]|uniref:Mitochondrial inner membrane protease ATP23 n=1 Tax=Cephalotrichum gorgonifer TaxID=2041049 RepID=A0AAE8N0K4_9PEZI|nr:related to Ku70-binding protein [Cephalotrichum gorgonifer]